jgi:hypothetical protein
MNYLHCGQSETTVTSQYNCAEWRRVTLRKRVARSETEYTLQKKKPSRAV